VEKDCRDLSKMSFSCAAENRISSALATMSHSGIGGRAGRLRVAPGRHAVAGAAAAVVASLCL
jgi:hypothetical protein